MCYWKINTPDNQVQAHRLLCQSVCTGPGWQCIRACWRIVAPGRLQDPSQQTHINLQSSQAIASACMDMLAGPGCASRCRVLCCPHPGLPEVVVAASEIPGELTACLTTRRTWVSQVISAARKLHTSAGFPITLFAHQHVSSQSLKFQASTPALQGLSCANEFTSSGCPL